MQNQGRLVEKEPWRVNRQAQEGNRQEAQEVETARMMKSCRFLFLWQKKREFLGGFTFSLYLCKLITHVRYAHTSDLRTKKNEKGYMKPTAILLLHCPDQPGIISEVTRFITDNQGNIVYLDQYVDKVDGMFFMRLEWELEHFLVPQDKILEYINTLYAQRYQMSCRLYFSEKRPRMAIFVSKMSHCLYDLLARWKAGEWDIDIPCIVSNHEDLRYVADQFGIPYYVWSIKKDHSNKEEVEKAEMELLRREKVTFIVLARYMQIISDEMIAAYPNHIINIHHSFLPAFIGAKPYHQAWERGVKIIGATSHYVTAELDAGPIIEQDVTRITHKDTPESLVLKGKDLEKIVLSHAVSKHIQRKILTYKNKTIIFS